MARYRRHHRRELAREAVQHGGPRLAHYRSLVPAPAAGRQIDFYLAGLILLAAAPCTAMVFVWSNRTDGEPNFTLSQVALNDTIMVFAFAPAAAIALFGFQSGAALATVVGVLVEVPVMLSVVRLARRSKA
jgi:arsenite transporter